MTNRDFDEWLAKQDTFKLPLVAWGEGHTQIALKFAEDVAARSVRKVLDEALIRSSVRLREGAAHAKGRKAR